MTITEDFGKFKATLYSSGSFARRSREVELEICWISCGLYQINYYRPDDAVDAGVTVGKDWYPDNVYLSFTPEQFDKVIELHLNAPKQSRDQCYKPFYEDYDLDRCMFDFGNDSLFQAFRSPVEEKVYLVKRNFSHGTPTEEVSVLGLSFEDLSRLNEFLNSKKDLIFYSGCKFSVPSPTVSALNAVVDNIQQSNES